MTYNPHHERSVIRIQLGIHTLQYTFAVIILNLKGKPLKHLLSIKILLMFLATALPLHIKWEDQRLYLFWSRIKSKIILGKTCVLKTLHCRNLFFKFRM